MELRDQILDISRQANIGELSPYFENLLDEQIRREVFLPEASLEEVGQRIVADLIAYKDENSIHTVVLGMSGGVDSALTAALFKAAGWEVIGVTMPILQEPSETQRGIAACEALDVIHIHKDLSNLYGAVLNDMHDVDSNIGRVEFTDKATKIRRGNIRARLRMITLYNLAAGKRGLVASTDNYSELGAGFWTLHGDVGDLSPIQSLLKSWEVPMLAKLYGVPEATWRATPTDGLGIDAGDEAQLGATYLEWDLMVEHMQSVLRDAILNSKMDNLDVDRLGMLMGVDADMRASTVYRAVTERMGASWFKRLNPVNLPHAVHDRYTALNMLDNQLFRPSVVL